MQENPEQDWELAGKIRDRMRKNGKAEVKGRWLFALQAPTMLLMLSVMTFLAGLGSVILSPLAHHLAWNNDAKVTPFMRHLASCQYAEEECRLL